MPPLDATATYSGFLLRSNSQEPELQTLQALPQPTSSQPDAAFLIVTGRVWQCLAYCTYPIKAILIATTANGHRKCQNHQLQNLVNFIPGRKPLSHHNLNQELWGFHFPYQLKNEIHRPAYGPEVFTLLGNKYPFCEVWSPNNKVVIATIAMSAVS